VKAQTGRWIGEGWDLVKADIGVWILITLVFFVVNSCVPLILQGPMLAGMHLAAIRKLTQGRVDFGDLFKPFNMFGTLLVASLLITLFVFMGSLACIIPAFVVMAMYQFAYLFIIDKKMDFWPAMQASHNIVKQDYFGFTMFVVVAGLLLQLLGVLLCIVGILVTFPIWYAAITVAYRDIVGFEPGTPSLS
jgi:uncharacterized membrane protein